MIADRLDSGDVVNGYQIERTLGVGSQGKTYCARSVDGNLVAIKELDLRSMAGWKSLELFQREIDTLRELDHPDIPTFIEAFEADGRHYLVQQFVNGETLSAVVDRGALREEDVIGIATAVARVLDYLHTIVPAVVHRDIKPGNIVQRPDGSLAVVDFGGVQAIAAKDTGGSTVIGTTGYMPPEQLTGRAEPRSDLYALGATLVHLVTGMPPRELPVVRMRIEWERSRAPRLAPLIDDLLQPVPEDRPKSARQVLERLSRGPETALEPAPTKALTSPVDSRILRRDDRITIDLTAQKKSPSPLKVAVIAVLLLLAFLVGGVAVIVLWVVVELVVFKALDASTSDHLSIPAVGPAEYLERNSKSGVEQRWVGRLLVDGEALTLSLANGQRLQIANKLPSDVRRALTDEITRFRLEHDS